MAKKATKANRASEAILATLHEAVAMGLLAKLQSGEATAAEISVAVKFLKDNGIEAVLDGSSTAEKVAHALPSFDSDDAEDYGAPH